MSGLTPGCCRRLKPAERPRARRRFLAEQGITRIALPLAEVAGALVRGTVAA